MTDLPYAYPTNIRNMTSLLQYNNSVTNDMFGYVILLMVFTILFSTFKSMKYDTQSSLAASLFITFISSTMLWLLGLVSDVVPVTLILVTGATIFITYKGET